MPRSPLAFEPGTGYRYSLCHDVLGALIEVWSGESFGTYMKKNILDVVGMPDTFFGLPKDKVRLSRMAALYTFDENKKPQRRALECPFILSEEYESGGAGLCSSTEDYALFLDAIACGGVCKNGNRLLKPETVAMMRTPCLNDEQYRTFSVVRKGYNYGLGVRVHVDNTISGSLSPLGEFGWDGAAGAFSMVDPHNKISLTYFQQIHAWDVALQNGLRNALYQDLAEQE